MRVINACTTYALEAKIAFLFEERSESYIQYGEVSTAEEKVILDQEAFQHNWLSQLAGKGGV